MKLPSRIVLPAVVRSRRRVRSSHSSPCMVSLNGLSTGDVAPALEALGSSTGLFRWSPDYLPRDGMGTSWRDEHQADTGRELRDVVSVNISVDGVPVGPPGGLASRCLVVGVCLDRPRARPDRVRRAEVD